MTPPTRERRHDLDWLRVLAVLLLIPFHTARIFDAWPFYVKYLSTSALAGVFVWFCSHWHMPLFMAISGMATWYALGHRSAGQYAGERLRRLGIPLLFGLAVIIPPQVYYAVRFRGGSPAPLQSWLGFFDLGKISDLGGYDGRFSPGHLWFIAFLLVFSLVALPVFLYLRGEKGKRLLDRLAAFCSHGANLLWLAVPLAVIIAVTSPFSLGSGSDGKNPFYFITFFILGYLLMADGRFGEAMAKQRHVALVIALAVAALRFAVDWTPFQATVQAWPVAALVPLGLILPVLETWCWLIALFGFGRRYLNHDSPFLRYANPAAFPVYILHQTVIIGVGYYVLRAGLTGAAAFITICLLSLAVTLALYEAVRRAGVLRFLFGMPPAKPAVREANISG